MAAGLTGKTFIFVVLSFLSPLPIYPLYPGVFSLLLHTNGFSSSELELHAGLIFKHIFLSDKKENAFSLMFVSESMWIRKE